ncbi:molecular chaperone DjiA [Algicella marina]|uniref:DnaJ domain-containing protein n=1 Tax=Algicella marina TaxID=2683284 RepID=A0A6P1SX51_9RHOB|nr:molecular chaperone DjiA [Algicella marina]QHQ33913.1 DnaJ domain-containing protein [Algicella marina]
MSIWTRILEALKALATGEHLSEIFDRLRTPPERSIAFTIAVISLGAKMAKADGAVSQAEVAAFREVFHIAREDEESAARVFNLARQDVAGYEFYAARIGQMFADDREVLENILEGLFHISTADGFYHDAENEFLRTVAEKLGLTEACFRKIRARYVPDAEPDPYTVLGVPADAPLDEIRGAWRGLIRETHPDRLIARGLPEEAIKLATRRLAAINDAWEEIQRTHPRQPAA